MTWTDLVAEGVSPHAAAKLMRVPVAEAFEMLNRMAWHNDRHGRALALASTNCQNGAYQGMRDWQDKAQVGLSDRLPQSVGENDRLSPKLWEPKLPIAVPQASA